MKTNYVQDLQAALLHISRVMLGPPLSDHECAELAQFAQRVVYGDAHAPKEDYERLLHQLSKESTDGSTAPKP